MTSYHGQKWSTKTATWFYTPRVLFRIMYLYSYIQMETCMHKYETLAEGVHIKCNNKCMIILDTRSGRKYSLQFTKWFWFTSCPHITESKAVGIKVICVDYYFYLCFSSTGKNLFTINTAAE